MSAANSARLRRRHRDAQEAMDEARGTAIGDRHAGSLQALGIVEAVIVERVVLCRDHIGWWQAG